jgi:hypothetical protein
MADSDIIDIGTVYPGNVWPIAITVTEIDGVTPFNLTGATLKAGIGGYPGYTGTPQVISAIAGQMEVVVPSATTIQ